MAMVVLVLTDLHAYTKVAEPTLSYGSPVLYRVLVPVERLDWRERVTRRRRGDQIRILSLQELPHALDVVLPVEIPTCREVERSSAPEPELLGPRSDAWR